MAWQKPEYSRNQVNRAGQTLCTSNHSDREYQNAIEILNNWRSCHSYPINTFQATLRQKVEKIDSKAFVAQRLKRTPAIISKLQRFTNMKLSRMQDIGGLRAVVATVKGVYKLEESYKQSRFKHQLVTEQDYIRNPKSSGYRSVHMVYRYRNDSATAYDGLLLELQIRTRLQHAWATAVETMGTFLNYSLKSSEGPEQWLNFFSITGSAFAYLEDCPPVPKYAYLSRQQTFQKVINDAHTLDVKNRLAAFAVVVDAITSDKRRGSYHLIVLNPEQKTVTIRTYSLQRLEQANQDYTQEELHISEGEPIQVVLVSAGPIENLRRAYPNFFLDTGEFVKHLTKIENRQKKTK